MSQRNQLQQVANVSVSGISPGTTDTTVIARTAVSKGDLLMFDMAASDSNVSSVEAGSVDSIYANVIAPTDPAFDSYFLCVALAAASSGASVQVRLEGHIDEAYVIKSSGNVAIGDSLYPDANKNLSANTASSGDRIIGFARAAVTGPSTRTLAKVYFNGFPGGFGFLP